MKVAQMRRLDVANGPGIRVSLFVSGCKHNCFNCFNKEYQDYNYGDEFGEKQIKELIKNIKSDMISGISFLGGEPMDHPIELSNLIDILRKHMREDQDIWLWSGYTIEEILLYEDKKELLKRLDTLVDGKFINSKKDLRLKFRGSSNQRVINVQESIKKDKVVVREGY